MNDLTNQQLQTLRDRQQECVNAVGSHQLYTRYLAKSHTDKRYKLFADGSISFNPYMKLSRNGIVTLL